MANKTLHLFTAQYPFGNKSETFLETEIKYLAEGFDQVIIYPSSKTSGVRPLPKNCEVNEIFCSAPVTKLQKIGLLVRFLRLTLLALNYERKDKGFTIVWRGRKILLDIFGTELLKFELLRNNKLFNDHDVYYSYWYLESTIALAIARSKKLTSNLYTRAHSYDLYDEKWPVCGVPYRGFIYSNVTCIFFISKLGMSYFFSKLNNVKEKRAFVSYLGVSEQELTLNSSTSSIHLVSCSSLLNFKNVHKIPKVLNTQKAAIQWTHMGNGPELDSLNEEVAKLNSNVTFRHLGHINNSDVINFYKNNTINGFISLSDIEGLPVSMMEALSFGIPILAKNVGGIAELITDDTGILIESNDDPADKLKLFLEKEWNRSAIRDFQRKHFDAGCNYSSLVELLHKSN